MEWWVEDLRAGRGDRMWDGFIERYRRLIFSAIRHYLREPDDVMDVFAGVCEALRRDDFARLRRWADTADPRARFSTWLVTVVRHLTVDWLRHRDGRPSRRIPAELSPIQQQIYERVFLEGRSHRECFHLLAGDGFTVSERDFAAELAATYRQHPHAPRRQDQSRRTVLLSDDLPAPGGRAMEPDLRERLASLLGRLSVEDRLAVQLFVVDELAAADVARIVGWQSPKMVYNRVSRALASLRRELLAQGLAREDL
ncbi:MAG TPA: sigma-70 family RNA polymerase sigma factor [Gemmatimonadales bacterium]